MAVRSISDEIRARYPEDHRRLGNLQLSESQKDSVFRVLRTYGDSRMWHLTGAIQDAARETADSHGDQIALKRKLTEKLTPHFREMEELAAEMFPHAGGRFSLDLDNLPVVHKWHPTVQVDLGGQEHEAEAFRGRLLSNAVGVDGGVRAQVATLFESLEGELGDLMPGDPVRMLTAEKGDREESLMECLSAAVSEANPTLVFKCLADDIHAVISMMLRYVNGRAL